MENSELNSKYQKLATEYAKLRAQVNVLKKAVLDEQAKNAELKDELQVKDQTIRKNEQEMDSLSFRNTQLEKRVGFLQEELSSANSKGRKKPQQDVTVPGHGQFDLELLSKIDENIQLNKKIAEMEESHRNEIEDMNDKLQSRSPSDELLEKQNELESELRTLKFTLQNALDEIEAYREQVDQLQEKIRSSPVVPQGPESDNTPDLVEKLTTAEQMKEHWMLEYQLLKMKYSKIFMKWEEAKGILKQLGKEDLMSGEITPSTETVQSFTSMVGKIDIISDDPQAWGRSYEKEVKEYLTGRVNELIALLQLSDSKAVTFYSEVKNLEAQLKISLQKQADKTSLLKNMEGRLNDLNEELNLTKGTYESQLSTMTEHLANMNEKLTAQKDTIDELNYQLAKGGKKR